ncbi:hypothetical protein [Spirosoma spitsbergense]|jgi:hypothetical protein|uniref:hypothetical protein n=1 Tax=Spirosoma spitsbergense TaxID=431554 RepID=UPI000363DD1C|nr:hypothetical protein [Spirosoma spitsbergense]
MGNQKESFDKLLEKYVFNAAAQFIDQVDPEMQTKIIDLLNHIGKTTPPTSAPINCNSLELTTTFPAESCDIQLERQWKEALRKPVRKKRIKNEIYGLTRRLIDLYQIRIESTIFCIGQLQRLLKRSHNTISDRSRQSYLINHYQSIIDNKAAYLTKMQALQQKELNKVHA